MNTYKKHGLVYLLGAVIFLMASAIQAQESAGTAVSVRGMVTATDAKGEVRRLRRGDEVLAGDTITTAKRSRIRMSFSDGGTSVLLANTTFEITDYSFSGQEDGTERASFKLLEGALEAISGLIGKKNKSAFRLDTPMATIGLRGTVYSVTVYPASGGGRPRVVVSTLDGAIVFASSAVPNGILVAAGNSVQQTGNTPPTTSNSILVPLSTITVDGNEDENAIEDSFDEETPTEEETRTEETRTDEEVLEEEGGESTVDTEAVPEIIRGLAEDGNLTDEQLADVAAQLLNTVSQTETDEGLVREIVEDTVNEVPADQRGNLADNLDTGSCTLIVSTDGTSRCAETN